MERLQESLTRNGWIKPAIVRELPTGGLEILGGQHRVEAAISLRHEQVPVYNLGKIDDIKAKEVGLIDNARYGSDDSELLAEIIKDIGEQDVALFLPFSDAELAALKIDFSEDDIDALIDGDEDEGKGSEEKVKRDPPSHTIMRFRVHKENEDRIRQLIEDVKLEQGFTEEDELTNAGDALAHIATELSNV
jgi:ParB-like chromosome segregation protein Spo0J